jgi:hypothetical protein
LNKNYLESFHPPIKGHSKPYQSLGCGTPKKEQKF